MKTTLKSRHAFTIIEIMVAMAIFGLVLAAIYSTWTLILKGSKSGLAAAAEVQRQRVAIQTIETTLSSVRSFESDLDHYSFVVENTDPATLSFAARLPDSFPRAGKFGDFDVRRVLFSVENTGDGERSLVLRQWPVLMDMDDDERDHPLVLARNMQDFIVETWDAQAGDWTDVWDQTNQVPPLVKVTLSFNSGGRNSSYSSYSHPNEQFTRVMALPSVTVPTTWQTPSLQGGNNQGGRIGQGNQGGRGGQGNQNGRGGQGRQPGGGQNNQNNQGPGRVRLL